MVNEEKLEYSKENGWVNTTEEEKTVIFDFCEGYIDFLNNSKTERESVVTSVELLKRAGFKDIKDFESLAAGDKIYYINKKKSLYAAVIGKADITEGANILGAHIDSPRLDLKPNPLYESGGLALFKTHYYGGIRKYQWTSIPLALHGVVVKTDGTVVDINIGEDENDPVFMISDLLPHLSASQNKKPLSEAIAGEDLNVIIGSLPMTEIDEDGNVKEVKNPIKNNILNLLNEKYGIKEIDFNSAEIEVVPAYKAKSMGLDRSLIAAYGHDDKVCAYPELCALMNIDSPEKTAICILSDKEEVGSQGNTGMYSLNFELFLLEMLEKMEYNSPYILQKLLSNSKCLSADVTAAYDPTFPSVMEKNNATYINQGIAIEKYTGARGKSSASDANAEFVAYVRGIFEKAEVAYQFGELGKVDEGGGGTIAYILANKGMEVLDCGVPVLSMHAPYEVVGKYDVYMSYKAYKAFLD